MSICIVVRALDESGGCEHYCTRYRAGEWYEIKDTEKDLVWRPAVGFLNVFDIQKLLEYGGTYASSYWLQSPHFLEYAETVKVTISCEFDFTNFPFDNHICDMDMGDPIYEVKTLKFANVEVYYKYKGILEMNESTSNTNAAILHECHHF